MSTKRHLAFDLGAESGRAIVGEIIDGKLQLTEIHRFATQGLHVNGSMRWDVYRLFGELKKGIKQYVKTYGSSLSSIGVDTWAVDFGLLDKRGKLIGIPYHYRDKRNEGTDEILEEKMGHERVYELTGIQFLYINTINQLRLNTEYPPSFRHLFFIPAGSVFVAIVMFIERMV